MGLIREPKNVDFTVQSIPWTEEELKDFRKLMNDLKAKYHKRKLRTTTANSSRFGQPGAGTGKP
jgi:hypothetical protein